ncbi:acyltransferase domain-containing protein [Nonomuraea sp. SBT364]|uniref:acyltransferase domain-containing protein n=1 Tax=Nonomuraea sp. SBT364 TaxID=1580530 RepID=UPI00066AB1A9|nr:acyltransferase domain-containing protein [Nonomuraea sp. SBT364]
MPRATPEPVYLVPGQGGDPRGALLDVHDASPAVRTVCEQVLDEIEGVLTTTGAPWSAVRRVLFDRSRSLRMESGVPQLAGYAISVIVGRLLSARLTPRAIVGQSFGEIAALVCAGAFDVADGTRAVCALNAAFRQSEGRGAMVLLPELGEAGCLRLLARARLPDLTLACVNAPDQTIVSGPVDAVEALLAFGGTTMTRLAVPYAAHHPALGEVADRFLRGLGPLRQRPLRVPVHSPVHGRVYDDRDDLRRALAGCVTQPVHLPGTLRRLGPGHQYIELSAGDALTRCVRATLPGARAVAPLAADRDWLVATADPATART